MEMLEEQQREEMELAALQEEQENEQVKLHSYDTESVTKLWQMAQRNHK